MWIYFWIFNLSTVNSYFFLILFTSNWLRFVFFSTHLGLILSNFLAKDSFDLIRWVVWKSHVGWKLILTTCPNDYCKSKRATNFQFLKPPNTRWLNLITHKKRRKLWLVCNQIETMWETKNIWFNLWKILVF